jgi:hypothetical protein
MTQAHKDEESAERENEFFHTFQNPGVQKRSAPLQNRVYQKRQKMALKKPGACIYTNVETDKEAGSKCS